MKIPKSESTKIKDIKGIKADKLINLDKKEIISKKKT